MGDNQGKSVPAAVSEPAKPQNSSESVAVEAKPLPDQKASPPAPPAPASVAVAANPPQNKPADDLAQLTPAILEALSFDSANKTEQELRAHNVKLQGLLGRVIELLKEKSSLCTNLEKQNNALMIQTNSLKDVVAITKDLLSIRNMEVEHLHVDIKSMEEKINNERERHNNMINRMSEAVKLNENLKAEYQSQLQLFTDLRASYEKKLSLLEAENKRLTSQLSGGSTADPSPAEGGEGEGGVQLTLEAIPPP